MTRRVLQGLARRSHGVLAHFQVALLPAAAAPPGLHGMVMCIVCVHYSHGDGLNHCVLETVDAHVYYVVLSKT